MAALPPPSTSLTGLESDLSDYFGFEDALNAYFVASGTPTSATLDGMVQALKGRATAVLGPLGRGSAGAPPISITGGYDSTGNPSFDVLLNLTKTRQVPLALGSLAKGAGISSDGTIFLTVTSTLQMSFSFGIDSNGVAFYT